VGNSRKLVIVESPAKATKIASYLGKDYVVLSSRGHVRDLPTSASEVPAKYKGEPWARTGIDVNDGFRPLYVVTPDKRATVKQLKDAMTGVDELYLATDEDREGEAIAWHLLAELKPKVPVKRMVFHEITPSAIADAVRRPRDVDLDLVDAQETRRILDRLYGYEVSPVLWKKVMPRLSAGRVQSVATRLVVDRERERIAFVPAAYADITATLAPRAADVHRGDPATFGARLIGLDGRRLATGRDFTPQGRLKADGLLILDAADAETLASSLVGASFAVAGVEAKPLTLRPAAPFRTTTLQQEAGRKLGFTTARTMSVAQELYESGFITYMRTDSVTLSDQAIRGAREQIEALYGREYLPPKPRTYTSKVKNAQEAHEAIRPAGEHFPTPADTRLGGDKLKLYELVWQRTLASQMADAQGQSMTVKIDAALAQRLELASAPDAVRMCDFTASGRTITFQGFRRVYVETSDDADGDEEARPLPQLSPGQHLDAREVTAEAHQTKAPARYTEPSLVAKLEELEIGRPSTYASIIRTITERDYVFRRGSALVPTWLAFAVTRLLEQHFTDLVDYAFTAGLEDKLDEIAAGTVRRLDVLHDFYFGADAPGRTSANGLAALVSDLGDIDARELSTFPLGEGIDVRVGRYGTYVEDAEGARGNVPETMAPDELTLVAARDLLAAPGGAAAERTLGTDPATGHTVVARDGRYGPYVTEAIGEDAPATKGKAKAKPRTASLFKTMTVETVTLDDALRLLSLPRVVGTGDDGQEITAQNGRYGPYLKRGERDYRSLTSEDELFTVTLEQAKALYAAPPVRGRRQASPAGASVAAGEVIPARVLGDDPNSGAPIQLKAGRFGPYVTDGTTNATIPRTDDLAALTLDRAVELLADKRAKGPAPKRTTARTPPRSTARSGTNGSIKRRG